MKIYGTIRGGAETVKKLRTLDQVIRDELRKTVRDLGTALKLRVQKKLSGPVLKAPTGNLRGAINVKNAERDGEFTATVGVNLGTVPYARIHEYGGVIFPKTKPYLVFKTPDGAWHSVRQVVIPERSYLRSSLHEMVPTIEQQIRAALKRAVEISGLQSAVMK